MSTAQVFVLVLVGSVPAFLLVAFLTWRAYGWIAQRKEARS